MASIDRIAGNNIESFGELIPELLKQDYIAGEGIRFYGIEDEGAAAGVIILRENADTAELKYLYVLPEYRGTGLMDEMLTVLFLMLREEGYRYVQMFFVPEVYPELQHLSVRFGFSQKRMEYAYFRFTQADISHCKAAAIIPQGILRLTYLPEEKKRYLFDYIEKNFTFRNVNFSRNREILPYSMAYMSGDVPKGALVIERSFVPEPGAYDLTLFFVGAGDQKAPISLLSGLCKLAKKELPENTHFTGYFPEGYVTRLIEGVLGVKGKHEVAATLNLEAF